MLSPLACSAQTFRSGQSQPCPEALGEIPDGGTWALSKSPGGSEVRPELALVPTVPDMLPTGSGIKGTSPPCSRTRPRSVGTEDYQRESRSPGCGSPWPGPMPQISTISHKRRGT